MTSLNQKIKSKLAFIILVISIVLLNVADYMLAAYVPGIGEVLPVVLISGLLLLSALATMLAEGTSFPPFLVAIFVGLSLQGVLSPIVESEVLLSTVITVSAVYILFGGGLEIVFSEFKKILMPTILLSFVGLLCSVFLFPYLMSLFPVFADYGVTISVALLLGAVLASTDPAAIIPVMKKLSFRKNQIKDIVISESALTDVTGALVTFSFLHYLIEKGSFASFSEGAASLVTSSSLMFLSKEIAIGIAAGLIGFITLHFFLKRKESVKESAADVAIFIAIPLMAFGIASLFNGSGYLAAFISGLMILIHEKAFQCESFFGNMTDGIAKPLIFIFLGAIVDVDSLIRYAVPGILAGLLFICVVRPVCVFVSLWFFRKKARLSVKDLLFISSIRETGVIPAILLLQVVATPGLGLGNEFLSIGMWIIVMTLVLLPPITPWIAAKLDVAHPAER